MGKVGRAVFGGSKQKSKSESGNYAYEGVSKALGPAMNYTGQSGDMISSLLGMKGDEGQSKALDTFANSSGYDFLYNKGADKIMSNQAMNGLLRSGSTLKGLTDYRVGLNQTMLKDFMDSLFRLSDIGLKAGGVVSSAGNWSTGKSSGNTKNGIVPAIGSLIPG